MQEARIGSAYLLCGDNRQNKNQLPLCRRRASSWFNLDSELELEPLTSQNLCDFSSRFLRGE
jgi:hypothetical protein